MKDFNKKLLTLTAAVILACGIFVTGMADTAVGTVVVTREMAADTQRRYTLIVDGVEVPLKEGVYENAILAESEAYGRFGSSSQEAIRLCLPGRARRPETVRRAQVCDGGHAEAIRCRGGRDCH